MIVNSSITPDKEIYYLGAICIEILNEFENNIHIDIFDFFELFQVKEKITMNLFLLILDWLFVLGLIDNKNGVIKKCF
jgi:hypothetical protein